MRRRAGIPSADMCANDEAPSARRSLGCSNSAEDRGEPDRAFVGALRARLIGLVPTAFRPETFRA